MLMLTFKIPGKPIPKARPRFSFFLRKRAYTPKNTLGYEAVGKLFAREAMKDKGMAIIQDGPVHVQVGVYVPIPKSWGRAKASEAYRGKFHPAVKPDLDNYVKTAMDICNGEVFRDDSQVCTVFAFKVYAHSPMLRVKVSDTFNGAIDNGY